MALTKAEIGKYKRAIASYKKASAKVEALRSALMDRCNHPKEFVSEFEWEYDNGYGRQSMHRGNICTICRSRQYYPRPDSLWTA